MKPFKLQTWHWVTLTSLLLVLVVFYVAYDVFVPKVRELQDLQETLRVAKAEQSRLQKVALPKVVTLAEKGAFAKQVPVDLDQSRFLKMVREQEQKTGVKVMSMKFESDGDGKDSGAAVATGTAGAPAKGTTNATPAGKTGGKAANTANASNAGTTSKTTSQSKLTAQNAQRSTLTEAKGSLSVQGNYEQVRQFLSALASVPRFVSYDGWHLTTEDVVENVTLNVYHGQANRPAPPTWALQNPFLTDRTPLKSQEALNQVQAQVHARYSKATTQHDFDVENLELQQTYNRFMAGMLGMKQAESVLEQDYAGHYVQQANPNISQVLGFDSANGADSALPVSFVGAPVHTMQGKHVTMTLVHLDIDFSLYYAPQAQNLLPALDPITTYTPSNRTNPVEIR